MPKKIKGYIKTNIVNSDCHFEFTMPDAATDEEIEQEVREEAFNYIEWSYEIETDQQEQ